MKNTNINNMKTDMCFISLVQPMFCTACLLGLLTGHKHQFYLKLTCPTV